MSLRRLIAAGVLLAACAPATARAQAPAAPLIISEYRNVGPNGAGDQFIEIYNTSATSYTVPANVYVYVFCSGGGQSGFANPGTVIGAHRYLRADGSAFTGGAWDPWSGFGGGANFSRCSGALSLTLYQAGPPDTYTAVDTVRARDSAAPRYGSPEGAPIPHDVDAPGNATGQPAVIRRLDANGYPIDTNDNASDFLFVNGDGTGSDGIGVPAPKGPSSPIPHDADTLVTLADPGQPATAAPNQVQVGSGAGSTLFIRRVLKNQTGPTYTNGIQFRYRSLTVQGFNAPGQADLRPVSTADSGTHLATTVGGSTVTPPPVQGVNSEAYHAFPANVLLRNGQSIDLNFGFTVQRPGHFEIHAVVEAK